MEEAPAGKENRRPGAASPLKSPQAAARERAAATKRKKQASPPPEEDEEQEEEEEESEEEPKRRKGGSATASSRTAKARSSRGKPDRGAAQKGRSRRDEEEDEEEDDEEEGLDGSAEDDEEEDSEDDGPRRKQARKAGSSREPVTGARPVSAAAGIALRPRSCSCAPLADGCLLLLWGQRGVSVQSGPGSARDTHPHRTPLPAARLSARSPAGGQAARFSAAERRVIDSLKDVCKRAGIK